MKWSFVRFLIDSVFEHKMVQESGRAILLLKVRTWVPLPHRMIYRVLRMAEQETVLFMWRRERKLFGIRFADEVGG